MQNYRFTCQTLSVTQRDEQKCLGKNAEENVWTLEGGK